MTEFLYEKIANLSSIDFANNVIAIISADRNTYGLYEQHKRMLDTIELLKYGVCKSDITKLLESQTENIAVGLISGRILKCKAHSNSLD